jgi:hypothetical protein
LATGARFPTRLVPGALYEFEKKFDDAGTLTRRALALAQQKQTPDAIYRWQWQGARLLAKQGSAMRPSRDIGAR